VLCRCQVSCLLYMCKTYPHTQALKSLLEMVQCKAARFVCNSFARNTSVTALLERLNWPTLENRRIHVKVTMFYKIINNIVSIDLQPSSSRTRDHSQRFISISTRVNSYHHLFYHLLLECGTLSQLKLLQ